MACNTCDELLAIYTSEKSRCSGMRFWIFPGKLEDGSRLAAEQMDRLSQNCKDTSDALMQHWRQGRCTLFEKASAPRMRQARK